MQKITSMARRGITALGLLVCFSVTPATAQAPEPPSPNAVYLELLGNGVIYSVNYDRMVTEHISGRVGVMAFAGGSEDDGAGAVVAPVMVNYLLGEGAHRLETGVGVSIVDGYVDALEEDDESFRGVMGTATVGYRYQPPAGGWLFRAGFTPFFGRGSVVPWFGASVGYAF